MELTLQEVPCKELQGHSLGDRAPCTHGVCQTLLVLVLEGQWPLSGHVPIKGLFHDSLRVCITLLQLVFASASCAVQSSAASLPLLEWGFDFIVEAWLCVSVANICSQCMCAMHIHICMQHVHTDVCIHVCSSCTYAVGRSCQPQL